MGCIDWWVGGLAWTGGLHLAFALLYFILLCLDGVFSVVVVVIGEERDGDRIWRLGRGRRRVGEGEGAMPIGLRRCLDWNGAKRLVLSCLSTKAKKKRRTRSRRSRLVAQWIMLSLSLTSTYRASGYRIIFQG